MWPTSGPGMRDQCGFGVRSVCLGLDLGAHAHEGSLLARGLAFWLALAGGVLGCRTNHRRRIPGNPWDGWMDDGCWPRTMRPMRWCRD
jgi:hypothetical protein